MYMENVLIPLAKHDGMKIIKPGDAYTSNLTAMGETGTLTIDYPQSLVVAPISPTNNTVWELFGGTLRHVFESTESANGRTVVPVGDIMTGTTDTQRYWDLTRNIYSYSYTLPYPSHFLLRDNAVEFLKGFFGPEDLNSIF